MPSQGNADVIDQLAPGHWYMAPNTQLRSVVPVPTPCGSPSAIMAGWSGGAYDTRADRLLIWGGGHADYGGNEIYAFSIRTMTWARIWGPSPDIPCAYGRSCTETYSDGKPVARHTYNGLSFLPGTNQFWIQGGSLYCGPGDAGRDTWVFHLDTSQWARKADLPVCSACGALSNVSAYDPQTGHVFMVSGGNPLHEYDPVANVWTLRGSQGIGNGMTGTIDTKRHRFVMVGLQGVKVFDLNRSGSIPVQALPTTGATNLVGAVYPGIVYDPVSDRVIGWNGGSAIFALNMDTLVWTRHDAAPTNTVTPTAPTVNGTYGRFQYIPSKNAFVLVNSIDGNVYFYKFAAGGGTPSDQIAPSAPHDLRPR